MCTNVLNALRRCLSKRNLNPFRATIADDGGRRVTRWTGAAVASFASTLVRRRLNKIAPPVNSIVSRLNIAKADF
jgi:hypothetical protein